MVVGVPPFGCMPLVKTLKNEETCVGSYNEIAFSFNNKLQQKLTIIKSTLNLKTAYIDCYNPILDAVNNPTKYGN